MQVGGTVVQGPDHIDASISESSLQATGQCVDCILDHDHSIVRTDRQYSICQACILLFCSGHLKLYQEQLLTMTR